MSKLKLIKKNKIYVLILLSQLICILYIAQNIYTHFSNKIFLTEYIQNIFNSDIQNVREIDEKERVKLIMRYLKSHINYLGVDRNSARPILRASADETLKSGKGLCGDYVRVAIRLMSIANIEARRFYLFGKKWEHVILECKIGHEWFLVDVFNDPATEMEEEDLFKIVSPKFEMLKNTYVMNPWIDYHRVRFFHKWSFLNDLKAVKLPHLLVIFFESPYLIKATLAFIAFIILHYSRIKIK